MRARLENPIQNSGAFLLLIGTLCGLAQSGNGELIAYLTGVDSSTSRVFFVHEVVYKHFQS